MLRYNKVVMEMNWDILITVGTIGLGDGWGVILFKPCMLDIHVLR